MTRNIGLWVDQDAKLSVQEQSGSRDPGQGELLVEVLYSGINPADLKHATHLGVRSTVTGYDFCGTVIKTGLNSGFSIGDIIAGYTPTGIDRNPKYGSHQNYLVCPERMAFHVPSNMPHADAGCFLTVAMTAADTIFNIFKFPAISDTTNTPERTARGLLIWGASTSVGICALQFARRAGVSPIFVTASAQRHSQLRELGATDCFDYSSSTVVEDVQKAVQEAGCGPIMYALDAVGTTTVPSSADLTAQCASKDATLVSAIVQRNPLFKMPLALMDEEVSFKLPHGQVITIPPRMEDSQRAWVAVNWAVKNYGQSFHLPAVNVLDEKAEDQIKYIKQVADGSSGFGKFVIKHPLS